MRKKNKTSSPDSPILPFGIFGSCVLSAFILFFMLLPGGLITFHAIRDLLQQFQQSAPLTSLTGTLMAVVLGALLFLTGGFLLWKLFHAPVDSE